MHICLLEGDMSRSGGTERMTAWLANALCNEHQVSILSLRLQQGEVFFRLEQAVVHHVLPQYAGKIGIPSQIRWIHRYIVENNVDWIVNVDMGMGFYGILASKGTNAKTITWEHGNFYNNWGSRLFPYLRRYAARHSDAVVVLTNQDQKNYQTNIPRCAPLYVIPNPAQMHPYAYNNSSRLILSVGHLLENKGYHRAIEIAAKVLPQYPDWQWVICGEGPERQRLESMIQAAGLEKQIKLPGLIKDMEGIYHQAAMLVLTSEMEGLPMVLLEGKSYGLPLVAFDIMTGPRDIIIDGVNGFLVETFDLNTMAERIIQLIENEGSRRNMSQSAAIGMGKFSEEAILNTWKELLKGI